MSLILTISHGNYSLIVLRWESNSPKIVALISFLVKRHEKFDKITSHPSCKPHHNNLIIPQHRTTAQGIVGSKKIAAKGVVTSSTDKPPSTPERTADLWQSWTVYHVLFVVHVSGQGFGVQIRLPKTQPFFGPSKKERWFEGWIDRRFEGSPRRINIYAK